MRLLEVVMKQCKRLRELGPDEYLGTSIKRCPLRIEHVVVKGHRVERLTMPCSKCVLAKLYRSTYLIGTPTLTSEGEIRFIVVENRAVRKIFQEHKEDLVSVKQVDPRQVYLTPRQRQVLALLASGEASNISQVSRHLNISKPAALKLVRNALRKLARKYMHIE
ncbi:MAG: hypothetical protein F7C35_05960 [Desulfurococcales archaeon]|nr:hypothetical protein [Desulfurococcales archaeon]